VTPPHEQLNERRSLGDRAAIRFSRAITRRRLLQRGALVAASTGVATGFRLLRPHAAEAQQCSFTVSTWGCYCASTPSCGSARCCYTGTGDMATEDRCCGGATRRGNYWTSSPHCWCSLTCCRSGLYGFYSCCDCWKYGNPGYSPCVCKGFRMYRHC
jgi:hypothetical protein